MAGTSFRNQAVSVIVFDVDGTLYRQAPLRRAMLARLFRAHVRHPLEGWRTLRALSAYRRAQEHLRRDSSEIAANEQIRVACERTNIDRDSVASYVERWMEQEPLTILRRCVQPGLVEFLQTCRARGLRLAALSDYPAAAKLRALEIENLFEVVLSAQAPEIAAFKPHPRGLLVTLQRLGASKDECLYVGDRADVDAPAAQAAGVSCVILRRGKRTSSDSYLTVSSYPQLQDLLFGPSHVATGGVISAESYQ